MVKPDLSPNPERELTGVTASSGTSPFRVILMQELATCSRVFGVLSLLMKRGPLWQRRVADREYEVAVANYRTAASV